MIPSDIIEQYSPSKIELAKDTFIFQEGDQARFYYQIISGGVKMININEEGKEFVQGTFQDEQSFGEPPLFHDARYPASAKTEKASILYKLGKEKLFLLLKEYPEVHLTFTSMLSKRLMYKSMIMKEISSHDARHRLLTFFDHLKAEYGQVNTPFHIKLTRQQLSNLLGIRVETVIRTVKTLADSGEIKLEGRKILR
ncbi:Crp/Fnr family transcriptional regulator [Reichenbachiella versicolor]|uniref:Crp/Fnr family transcriptional regulator n=1 Tax=Reichenbachiella versicolor TaxID=1821036 RepID=UPI000D6E40C8|nr:Crp/Fnr family transcriptional regulator [Reichenbachiella versicolor]